MHYLKAKRLSSEWGRVVKIFLADLVHNCALGSNNVSGDVDYTVPLNVADLAAFARHHCDVDIDISIFKFAPDLQEAISRRPPDILGLSNYGWNTDLNRQIGIAVKAKHPEVFIVMGGPAIRTEPEGIREFLLRSRFVDAYVMFEGERPFVDIVNLFARQKHEFRKAHNSVKNCAYLNQADELIYEYEKVTSPIEAFPSPYLTGMLDPFLDQGLIPLFETNRGCPFHCTFCTWGVAALGKIRQVSEERVYQEMDYVANRAPKLVSWIIADANFGILPRDVEIARHINEIKKKTTALKRVMIWESKNTSDRNLEIAKLLGLMDNGRVLMALQTLEDAALDATKRKNIKFGDVKSKIKEFNDIGMEVRTDILFGLPGETYEGHLNTLRQCFDVGFDHITTVNTILLTGSEMESQESRDKYDLRTKYMVRAGSFGEYDEIRAIEYEEVIRGTSTMSEAEITSLTILHWLVWFGWNFGFMKPVLKYLQKEHGLCPVDVFLGMQERDFGSHTRVKTFFKTFMQEMDNLFFEDSDSLETHYLKEENWQSLMQGDFIKPEKTFNAKVLLDRSLRDELFDCLIEGLPESVLATTELSDLTAAVKTGYMDFESADLSARGSLKIVSVPARAAKYLVGESIPIPTEGQCSLEARYPLEAVRHIIDMYDKHNFKKYPLRAMERIMGAQHRVLQPNYSLG